MLSPDGGMRMTTFDIAVVLTVTLGSVTALAFWADRSSVCILFPGVALPDDRRVRRPKPDDRADHGVARFLADLQLLLVVLSDGSRPQNSQERVRRSRNGRRQRLWPKPRHLVRRDCRHDQRPRERAISAAFVDLEPVVSGRVGRRPSPRFARHGRADGTPVAVPHRGR